MGWSSPLRYLACLALSGGVVFLCMAARVNATTVALAMLLLVLGVATRWGLREGVFTSAVCMFSFNFFFLPPVGTLTITDPQNWIALTAFLVSAVVASQLSAKAKRRAEEAIARRSEIERLYRLSRVMLMDDEADLIRAVLAPIADIFGFEHVAFYESDTRFLHSADPGLLNVSDLNRTAGSGISWQTNRCSYVPVRLGTRVVGSLGFVGPQLTVPEQESIANLVAIGFERMRAMKRVAEAEAAREGERLKTFVLDGIAHDLKTPLTAIKTCVTTLITIAPESEEKRSELLTIIDEETDRLSTTISEAIQLARIEAHKIALQRSRHQLHDLFEALLESMPEGERFDVRIPTDLAVSVDGDLMLQALRQLLGNALKYSGPGAPIEIEAEHTEEGLTVRVLDRGPGISPRELERIFDKFYRGTRASSEGSGMGLAIARGIIEAHQGKIWAENRPGGGAVFVVVLAA